MPAGELVTLPFPVPVLDTTRLYMGVTHAPDPSQIVPPFWLQAVLNGSGGFEGTPAVQVSIVH